MVKERKMRFTAVILTVVMLLGMISAVAFAKTGVIAKAANAPVFSLSIVSETSSEVKVSFNLESGSFTAMDLQIIASDWNSASKTTGLTLTSIEKSQNYKDFETFHKNDMASPILAFNNKNGWVSFASGNAYYDVFGSMFVYTFKKTASAKRYVKPADFIAKFTSFLDGENRICVPSIIFKFENECKHTSTKHCYVAPTCSNEGEEYDLCAKCNEKLNYKKLAKKAHTWSAWQVTVQPTAEKEGYEVRMCTVCKIVETRKVDKITANVKSVSVSDLKLDYKKSATITPEIEADKGAKYTVKYSSSDEKIAKVDDNGKVYAAKKGTATITCTVTDSNGNTVTDTCNVTVKYNFGQWLIVIILFGWIWY